MSEQSGTPIELIERLRGYSDEGVGAGGQLSHDLEHAADELSALTAQLAECRRDAEKMRKRHESSHAEVLRLADELRKRDPTWGSPMRLNNAAIQESKK